MSSGFPYQPPPHSQGRTLHSTSTEMCPSSSTTGPEEQEAEVRCSICMEDHQTSEVVQTPCGNHIYCRECLHQHFQNSFLNQGSFPPKCCGTPLGISEVGSFLTGEIIQQFNKKVQEFDDKDRLYCHDGNCSEYIPARNKDADKGICPKCSKETCKTCKSAMHMGDCPEDENLKLLFAEATKEMWKRCVQCKTMVERDRGCNHITCACGYQFCYRCEARYRTCLCLPHEELPAESESSNAYLRRQINHDPVTEAVSFDVNNPALYPVDPDSIPTHTPQPHRFGHESMMHLRRGRFVHNLPEFNHPPRPLTEPHPMVELRRRVRLGPDPRAAWRPYNVGLHRRARGPSPQYQTPPVEAAASRLATEPELEDDLAVVEPFNPTDHGLWREGENANERPNLFGANGATGVGVGLGPRHNGENPDSQHARAGFTMPLSVPDGASRTGASASRGRDVLEPVLLHVRSPPSSVLLSARRGLSRGGLLPGRDRGRESGRGV